MPVELKMVLKKDDAGRARATLRLLSDRARNIEGGLKIVGEALLKEQNARFDRGEDPQGKKWQKLSPLTVMLRGGKSGPVLKRSGRLKQSGAWQVQGKTLKVGINTPYAAAQHFGAVIKPRKGKFLRIPVGAGIAGRNKAGGIYLKKVTIPARPIVGFGPRDEQAARHAIEDYLKVEGT